MSPYEWLTLALVAVGTIGVPMALYVHGGTRRRIEENRLEAAEKVKVLWLKHDEMVLSRERTAADHAEFKLMVAREYVTLEMLNQIEKRMDSNFRELKGDFKASTDSIIRALEAHRAEDAKR